jgi:hypothetical protein
LELDGKDLKKRKSILMDLWNELITIWESNPQKISREYVIERLKGEYSKEGISPIRGASEPKDLFDKELTSLYILGKYGMGLEVQYPEFFDKVFSIEVKMDQVNDLLLSDNTDGLRDKVSAIIGNVDGNSIARILRIPLTKIYFGFSNESTIKRVADSLKKMFPEQAKEVNKYIKFYAAFKIANDIDIGKIKNRITKEAFKQALALELNIDRKSLPSDKYIMKIASDVFKVSNKNLKNVFSFNNKKIQKEKQIKK